MKVNVIGAGAVGTLYGAVAAKHGAQVTLFGRGEHIEACGREVVVESQEFGTFKTKVGLSSNVPTQMDAADVVFVTVPLHQMGDKAIHVALSNSGSKAAYIPLTNGVTGRLALRQALRRHSTARKVVYGTTAVCVHVEEPGRVVHVGKHKITIGGREIPSSLGRELKKHGLNVVCSRDGKAAVWEKAAFLVPLAAACTNMRCDVGGVRRNSPTVWEMVLRAAHEIVDLANTLGIHISSKSVVFALDRAPRSLLPSSTRDVVLGGIPPRDTELPFLVEPILKKGEYRDRPMPTLRELYEKPL